jgi:hypothetical protein
VLACADAGATGPHLAEIGRHVTPGAHAVLVLDGAGRHGAGGLTIPDDLTLPPLPPRPPRPPEPNPVEDVWRHLRQNRPSLPVWPDCAALVATCCCAAWNDLMATPGRLASITRRERARTATSKYPPAKPGAL